MRLRGRIAGLIAGAAMIGGVVACAPTVAAQRPGRAPAGGDGSGRDEGPGPAFPVPPGGQPGRPPGDQGDRRAGRGQGQGRGAGRRGHRPGPVGPRREHAAADGQRDQGDDGPAGAEGRRPGPEDPGAEGRGHLRLEVRGRNRGAAPAGRAHGPGAAGGPAAALRGGCGVYPRQRLRARPGCLPGADERDRGSAGYDAHPFHLTRRPALPHRDLDLLHAVRPAHARPRGHAVPGFPVHRGPVLLSPGEGARSSRLLVGQHRRADRLVPGGRRDQGRLHR